MEVEDDTDYAVEFKGSLLDQTMKREFEGRDITMSALRLCVCVTVIW